MFNLKNSADVDGRLRSSRLPGERASGNAAYIQLRDRVQQRLLAEINPSAARGDNTEVRQAVERLFNETLAEFGLPMSRLERADIFERLLADLLGLGPLEALLADDLITEILVNGPNMVYIERSGKLELCGVKFRDNEDVMRVVERIVAPLGRRVDESSPMVDARLPDGSRVNVIIPPLSLIGPTISIRKFPKHALTPDELIKKGAMTPGIADFLRGCVKAALNIVVSGGTGTGKTTVLNALSSFIPENERILTIEDAAELRLQQQHVVRLEARPANVEGKGLISIRQLVINALRMRPDRIVVGEVRGGETLDMLQAMNTGHEGSLTTVHSNSARDTLRRVETMVLMAGMDLPLRAIREQIASAFDLIVHLGRLADGSRKIVQISEVQGMEGDTVVMQDIFQFVQTTVENGKVQGYFTPTGVRPKFYGRLEAAGLFVQPSTFMPTDPGRVKR
ncbi:MAG: CpaF family protein [Caldilinea sp.]|uniref:CpaF family protein n=1 Tax=Caldilinea sp. TaxID=2293560 RepID=UPI002BB63701|nr:CpaF family protein [Anaerolineales bacterium]HQY91294.1 CpaF family protein [Caldilinea sp.]HRA67790.1 CpaF family protein [Caldilinea sp.]